MATRTVTRECQNETAAWGSLCPDCGQRLPEDRGPLRSWMASRHHDEEKATNGADSEGWAQYKYPRDEYNRRYWEKKRTVVNGLRRARYAERKRAA